jgi:hypothetical protein
MTDHIADAAVARSLILEALKLLDGPEHASAAAHLQHAINELSPRQPREPTPSPGVEESDES